MSNGRLERIVIDLEGTPESAHDPLPDKDRSKFKRKLDITCSENPADQKLLSEDVIYEPPEKEKCLEAMFEMSNDLECPVCMMCLTPPIRTCWRGHGICKCCYTRVKSCPLCTSKLNPNQNTILDKIVSKLVLPCTYHKFGCNQMIDIGKKMQHESECKFRVLECPVSLSCGWRGKQREMATHLKQMHANKCTVINYNEKITRKMAFYDDYNMSPISSVNVNSLIIIDNEVLVLHVKGRRERTQHYVLQSFGNDEVASKFRYRLIHTSNKGLSLTYEATPIPNNLLLDNVWRSNKCHRIPWELYENFFEPNTQDETLQIQIFKNEPASHQES